MSNGFPSVTIEFDGEAYEVSSDRVWGLINAIEQHVTFAGLARRMQQGDVSRTAVCSALASALSYASTKKFTPESISEKLLLTDLVDQASSLLSILSIPESPKAEEAPSSPGKRSTKKKQKKRG